VKDPGGQLETIYPQTTITSPQNLHFSNVLSTITSLQMAPLSLGSQFLASHSVTHYLQ